jgi:putative addiction module killer protein
MKRAVEYLDAWGRSPFRGWFDTLDGRAAAKVTIAISRVEQGNTSNLKAVGRGVSGIKVDFGPGYRVYVGQDGDVLVILLGGGTKQRQQADIAAAQERWADYKARKKAQI